MLPHFKTAKENNSMENGEHGKKLAYARQGERETIEDMYRRPTQTDKSLKEENPLHRDFKLILPKCVFCGNCVILKKDITRTRCAIELKFGIHVP